MSLSEEGGKGVKPLLSKNVILLAENFSLSKAQEDLLNRGLSFVPTIDIHKNQKLQLQMDLQKYHRRIKLATYFQSKGKQDPPRFLAPSIWTPPNHKLPPEVTFLVKQDQKDFNKHFASWEEEPNLTEEEKKALEELIKNRHIVIKRADKGSAVVIMGRDQYIFEVNRQLQDRTYYEKLKEPIYLQTVPMVHKILDELCKNKFINKRQRQYLKGDCEPRIRRFYILPKIHKDPEKWTVPFKVPPGRPIVSDCGSETYQTAEFIDHYLNPLSVKHPSYIKDTYHFISVIKSLKIPSNSFFFTMDIESLYTNIDIKAGLRAVKNIFQKYPDAKRPDQGILQLLEINLTKNDFEFNKEYFLQIKGTAMGKRFAPAYANIFMAEWEEKALAKYNKSPFLYVRYLDDIFGIWTHSKEEFGEFVDTLDTHDSSIRLKYVINDLAIDYLDTTVYKGTTFKEDQALDIKVFFKETDTHALLFKTSFHPRHTFKGLIKSQLIRFKRICTQDEEFKKAVKILFGTLRKRGYSRSLLRICLKTFQIQKQKDKKEYVPLITNYSTISSNLHHKVKTNFQNFIERQGLLQNSAIISAYRRNRNLNDYLVRAKLPPMQESRRRSILMQNFVKLKYVQNRVNKRIFEIEQTFEPQTRNCVYIIFCSKCGKQYVGETENSISTRMMQHRYLIKRRKETETPIVKHFILHGWLGLRVAGLQSNSSWTKQDRRQRERRWIYLLDTKVPSGLNEKYN